MKYDRMVEAVEERAGLGDWAEAERTLRVVVQSLADRLLGDEADDLLAQLPEPLKSEIIVTPQADPMNPLEFVQRVAGDLGVPEDEARERVRAAFMTLHEAVTEGEWEDVVGQLDRTYAELIA
ncbi:MAG: hypothetical protein JWO17_2546 [Actinomycetia bacterium]|nr:hypothetical protein [Actinomycetes bacterium]